MEETYCIGTIMQLLRPDLSILHYPFLSRSYHRVLANRDHFIISEQIQRKIINIRHITTYQQRSRKKTP